MKYANLLYKRGFLFSDVEIVPPVLSWIKKKIGNYFISFDPENSWEFIEEKDSWVAFLGKAVDTLNWSMDIYYIVCQCLDRLKNSEEKMLDYIDYLNGRFILIYHHNGITKFMNDAFGTRSVFYSLHNIVLMASHYRIISNYLKSSFLSCIDAIVNDKRWYSPPSHGFPGNLTPYQGVFILTPNTLINIKERTVQRFYPRRELPTGNINNVIEEVSVLLKKQIELLHSQYKLVLSLTAGLDTRVTLAAARSVASKVLFFTYGDIHYLDGCVNSISCRHLPNINDITLASLIKRKYDNKRQLLKIDLITASEIAEALELRHVTIAENTVEDDDFQEFNQIIDFNTYHNHGRWLAKKYLDVIPTGLLHVRSNISGIGKARYRKAGLNDLPLTAERMAHAWHNGMSRNIAVVEAFHRFGQMTDFNALCNYDPYDMFLWEHHEGTWLTNVLIESDVAFDTFELFNCRILVEKLLSVSVEQRAKSNIHYGIIKSLWPLLLQWPINQYPYHIQLKNLQMELSDVKKEQKELVSNLAYKRKSNYHTLNKQPQIVDSISYQLGYLIIQAIIKPGRNTILLPYKLVKLVIKAIKIMKKNRTAKITGTIPEVEQSQE